ncbi:hypothetical protein QL285_051410 [Trifolium repens]|jgi:hypothetical protein|nr:hypothetical protein QL285_051410 [Trifolium repens]
MIRPKPTLSVIKLGTAGGLIQFSGLQMKKIDYGWLFMVEGGSENFRISKAEPTEVVLVNKLLLTLSVLSRVQVGLFLQSQTLDYDSRV